MEEASASARPLEAIHREVVEEETLPQHLQESPQPQLCHYCRLGPCITLLPTHPARLSAYGQPRVTNHTRRKGDYRSYYSLLKTKGLWRDPVYLERKEALGCYIDDVREVMPLCVVGDVRKRWPNPEGVPYCGHRRS